MHFCLEVFNFYRLQSDGHGFELYKSRFISCSKITVEKLEKGVKLFSELMIKIPERL